MLRLQLLLLLLLLLQTLLQPLLQQQRSPRARDTFVAHGGC